MNPRKDMNQEYNKTMAKVRADMGPSGKLWSYIIHFPPLEVLLSLLDRTVFRPVPLLTASVIAFLGGLGLYSMSLYNGYHMSGTEIPLLLISGLFIGIIIDYLKIFFGDNA